MASDINTKLPFRKRHPTLVRAVLLSLTFLVALGAGAVYASWALVCRGSQCPSIEILAEYTPHQTSKLYAVDGRFIAELGLERRTLVKIDEIPQDRAGRVRHHRRQALLPARRHRLAPRRSALVLRLLARRLRRRDSPPSRCSSRATSSPSSISREKTLDPQDQGSESRARDRSQSTTRRKFSSSISIRSTSATAPTVSRPRRSATSENPSAI